MSVTDVVSEFLKTALVPPPKEPRLQRDRIRNDGWIEGYAVATDSLRKMLIEAGHPELAQTRPPQESDLRMLTLPAREGGERG